MKFDAKVMGGEELGGRLIGLGRTMAKDGPLYPLERGVLAGAKVIADDARQRAPRDTGAGADSIAGRIVESKDGRVVAAIGPGREEFYLMFHEIGTSKMPATPFLVPAMDSKERQAINEARQVWRQAIYEYARQGGRDA